MRTKEPLSPPSLPESEPGREGGLSPLGPAFPVLFLQPWPPCSTPAPGPSYFPRAGGWLLCAGPRLDGAGWALRPAPQGSPALLHQRGKGGDTDVDLELESSHQCGPGGWPGPLGSGVTCEAQKGGDQVLRAALSRMTRSPSCQPWTCPRASGQKLS